MTWRRSCFAVLGVVFTLAGLLLMHGLDAPSADGHVAHDAAAADVDTESHENCDDVLCTHGAHVVAMCVAVLAAAVAAVTFLRRRCMLPVTLRHPGASSPHCAAVAVPPTARPAWIRLAVIRC